MEHYKELFSDSMNQLDELLKNVRRRKRGGDEL